MQKVQFITSLMFIMLNEFQRVLVVKAKCHLSPSKCFFFFVIERKMSEIHRLQNLDTLE